MSNICISRASLVAQVVKNLTANVLVRVLQGRNSRVGGWVAGWVCVCVCVCVSGERLIDFKDLTLWQTRDPGKESADGISNSYGEVRFISFFN